MNYSKRHSLFPKWSKPPSGKILRLPYTRPNTRSATTVFRQNSTNQKQGSNSSWPTCNRCNYKELNTNPSSRHSSSCRTLWKSSAATAGTALSNMPPSAVPTISVSPSRMVRKSRHKCTAPLLDFTPGVRLFFYAAASNIRFCALR